MILPSKPKTLAWCSVLLLTGVGLWGWTVDPGRPGRWLFVMLFVPALWGNFLPKPLSPWLPGDEPFDWSRVHRFAGWLFSVAGVAVVGVWLVVPQPDEARFLSRAIFGTAAVLAVWRKLMSLASPPARHARTRDTSPI